MTLGLVIVLVYYVIALAGFVAWTYADHARTRRLVGTSADADGRLAPRFARRVAVVLGLVAGVGVALLIALLVSPPPAILVTLAMALVDGLVTFGIAELVLRSWGRLFGTDLLSDLRPEAGAVPPDGPTPSGGRPEA